MGEALKSVLETQRLCLRPFDETDFAAVHSYARDPRVTRLQPWGPNSEDETRAFLARAVGFAAEADRRDFELAIVERASGRVIGGCGLHVRRIELREYEIGWTLHPAFWRRGIGAEAAREVARFAFGSLNAHRLYALIDPENVASYKLAEKIGFRREGHQKLAQLVRGEWRDSLVYGLLESDFDRLVALDSAPV